jgi:hypothetical protein
MTMWISKFVVAIFFIFMVIIAEVCSERLIESKKCLAYPLVDFLFQILNGIHPINVKSVKKTCRVSARRFSFYNTS